MYRIRHSQVRIVPERLWSLLFVFVREPWLSALAEVSKGQFQSASKDH